MTPRKFSIPTIGLHWLSVLLIILVYCTMEFRGAFERGSAERELVKSVHYMAGILVLALTVLRIWFRSRHPYPPIMPVPPLWQHKLAALVHLALYAMLLGMPLLGWLILSAEGHAVPFFGFELPALIAPDDALAESAEELHELIAQLGYGLIGLHAVAALYHHYVQKDNTLHRMKLKD